MPDIDRLRRHLATLLAASPLSLAGCAAGLSTPSNRPTALSPSRFVRLDAVPSRHTTPRRVTVWLPPGYDSGADRHDVLYMHDGQNLFDPATAMAGQPWAVDRHLDALIRAGKTRSTLVVGIDNSPQRWRDYVPAAPLLTLSPDQRRVAAGDADPTPLSDGYLAFLVQELKPRIDRDFRTRPERAHTSVMGSSMGGLISLYALARYPAVFGAAGCVSTHWPITTHRELLARRDPLIDTFFAAHLRWFEQNLPAPGRHRLYFDHGDVNLDALYPPLQRQVDAMLQRRGWREGVDWRTLFVPGGDHNEPAWRARLATPLQFLLAPPALPT